ncbi:Uncharacterized protein PBTT_07326 [Plasmodiophora brassicae]
MSDDDVDERLGRAIAVLRVVVGDLQAARERNRRLERDNRALKASWHARRDRAAVLIQRRFRRWRRARLEEDRRYDAIVRRLDPEDPRRRLLLDLERPLSDRPVDFRRRPSSVPSDDEVLRAAVSSDSASSSPRTSKLFIPVPLCGTMSTRYLSPRPLALDHDAEDTSTPTSSVRHPSVSDASSLGISRSSSVSSPVASRWEAAITPIKDDALDAASPSGSKLHRWWPDITDDGAGGNDGAGKPGPGSLQALLDTIRNTTTRRAPLLATPL